MPRDLPVAGRELNGIHFAMDYLYRRNRWVAQRGATANRPRPPGASEIAAAGKHVVVIGGGDTGADCVGNALREGAASVTQLELLPEPPPRRPDERTPWPLWPDEFRLSYAMQGGPRAPGAASRTTRSRPPALSAPTARSAVCAPSPRPRPTPPFAPVPGTEHELPAQLVLLAMGFLHPEQSLLEQLGVEKDPRGNVKAVKPYTTSVEGVFAAGDARRGRP